MRPSHEFRCLRMIRVEPCFVQVWRDDHRRTLFVPRLMELAHYGVLIRIDRQHGETDDQLARSRICPSIPKAGNAKRVTRGQFNLPTYSLARLVTGLVKVVDQHQSKLPLPPCGSVTGLLGGRLAACVVGVPTDLVVLGPARYQSEPSQTTCDAFRLPTHDHQRCNVTRIGFFRKP